MPESTPSPPAPRLLKTVGSPKLTVICLALLMVLTFWGTVYQVDQGLHAAKVRYFDSLWCTIGFVPLPGAQLVMGVLTVNLLAYLLILLLRDRPKFGLVLTHLGLLMLFLGGAVTHYYGDEAHLTLAEGETSNVASAYHQWELAAWRVDAGVREVRARNADRLRAGDVVTFSDPGLTVTVEQFFRNCRPYQDQPEKPVESARGITRLEAEPLQKEPERNRAGAVLQLTWPGGAARRVLLFGEDEVQGLQIGDHTWNLTLRHRRYPLPVTITLKDFRREMHPGTEMAKSYESEINVESAAGERDVVVSMNKPFRERGFTFYQASFSDDGRGMQLSTFAVTRNAGRLIPYIATLVVWIGMCIHFGEMLLRRARKAGAP